MKHPHYRLVLIAAVSVVATSLMYGTLLTGYVYYPWMQNTSVYPWMQQTVKNNTADMDNDFINNTLQLSDDDEEGSVSSSSTSTSPSSSSNSTSSTSSSNSTSSSSSSSSTSSSSSSSSKGVCLICRYQDFQVCNTTAAKADADVCVNTVAYNGEYECVWYDDTCMSGSKAQCLDEKKNHNPVWDRIVPLSSIPTDPFPGADICTENILIIHSHGGNFHDAALINEVSLCIQLDPTVPTTAFHSGCSVFQTVEQANMSIAQLQEQYPNLSFVQISANVTDSICTMNNIEGVVQMTCTTYLTYIVTPAGVTTQYQACHFDGGSQQNFCLQSMIGQTAQCTNSINQATNEVCCPRVNDISSTGYTTNWREGTTCPIQYGACPYNSSDFWCSTATANSWTAAMACLSSSKTLCENLGYSFVPAETCSIQTVNGWTSCNVQTTCLWQCEPPGEPSMSGGEY